MKEYIVRAISQETIDSFDAHNAPELVRCKDCKWYHQAFANEGRCVNHDNDFHKPDWFCADGERKLHFK